jgi:hypothetical protein
MSALYVYGIIASREPAELAELPAVGGRHPVRYRRWANRICRCMRWSVRRQLLLLTALHRSQRRADRVPPFGYGKERYFCRCCGVTILVSGAAFLSIFHGLHTILGGPESFDRAVDHLSGAGDRVRAGLDIVPASDRPGARSGCPRSPIGANGHR